MTTERTVEVGVGCDRQVGRRGQHSKKGGQAVQWGLHKIRGLAPLCQLCQETLKTSHPPVQTMTPPPLAERVGCTLWQGTDLRKFLLFLQNLTLYFVTEKSQKILKMNLLLKTFCTCFLPVQVLLIKQKLILHIILIKTYKTLNSFFNKKTRRQLSL